MYTDLKNVPTATDISCFNAVSMDIQSLQHYDVIDPVATLELPRDAPKGYVPVSICGDGNCFPIALSQVMYGSKEFCKEIRMPMLIEGVLSQHHYLDHDYLSIGGETYLQKSNSSCCIETKTIRNIQGYLTSFPGG